MAAASTSPVLTEPASYLDMLEQQLEKLREQNKHLLATARLHCETSPMVASDPQRDVPAGVPVIVQQHIATATATAMPAAQTVVDPAQYPRPIYSAGWPCRSHRYSSQNEKRGGGVKSQPVKATAAVVPTAPRDRTNLVIGPSRPPQRAIFGQRRGYASAAAMAGSASMEPNSGVISGDLVVKSSGDAHRRIDTSATAASPSVIAAVATSPTFQGNIPHEQAAPPVLVDLLGDPSSRHDVAFQQRLEEMRQRHQNISAMLYGGHTGISTAAVASGRTFAAKLVSTINVDAGTPSSLSQLNKGGPVGSTHPPPSTSITAHEQQPSPQAPTPSSNSGGVSSPERDTTPAAQVSPAPLVSSVVLDGDRQPRHGCPPSRVSRSVDAGLCVRQQPATTTQSQTFLMPEYLRLVERGCINAQTGAWRSSKAFGGDGKGPIIPQPFSFETREATKQKSIARRRFEQDMMERKEAEERDLLQTFKANPVPPSTFLRLYENALHRAKEEATTAAMAAPGGASAAQILRISRSFSPKALRRSRSAGEAREFRRSRDHDNWTKGCTIPRAGLRSPSASVRSSQQVGSTVQKPPVTAEAITMAPATATAPMASSPKSPKSASPLTATAPTKTPAGAITSAGYVAIPITAAGDASCLPQATTSIMTSSTPHPPAAMKPNSQARTAHPISEQGPKGRPSTGRRSRSAVAYINQELTFHPKINSTIPNYPNEWERMQQAKQKVLQQHPLTQPNEFRFRGQPKPKQQLVQAVLFDMERDEQRLLEQRWPYTNPRQAPVVRRPISSSARQRSPSPSSGGAVVAASLCGQAACASAADVTSAQVAGIATGSPTAKEETAAAAATTAATKTDATAATVIKTVQTAFSELPGRMTKAQHLRSLENLRYIIQMEHRKAAQQQELTQQKAKQRHAAKRIVPHLPPDPRDERNQTSPIRHRENRSQHRKMVSEYQEKILEMYKRIEEHRPFLFLTTPHPRPASLASAEGVDSGAVVGPSSTAAASNGTKLPVKTAANGGGGSFADTLRAQGLPVDEVRKLMKEDNFELEGENEVRVTTTAAAGSSHPDASVAMSSSTSSSSSSVVANNLDGSMKTASTPIDTPRSVTAGGDVNSSVASSAGGAGTRPGDGTSSVGSTPRTGQAVTEEESKNKGKPEKPVEKTESAAYDDEDFEADDASTKSKDSD